MRLSVRPFLSTRIRVYAAVAVGLGTVSGVAAAQHPSSGGAALQPAAAATAHATSPARSGSTTPPPRSGLRLLHGGYHFANEAALHRGAPQLEAAAGVLIDPDPGVILWARDAHTPRPPASTTKILTSIVALENLDPKARVDITAEALHQAPDETRLGMLAGDHYTVTELLEAMLLISANDAASAVAVDALGRERTVLAMNEQLAALGLHDSRFTNPVGLDDSAQQASPYDLAVLGLAAYDSFPLFRQIVGTRDLAVPASDGHLAYSLHNISRLMTIYPPAKGIKPGYTGDAGYCLVFLAERDGHRLVGTLMNDAKLSMDARSLLEWGYGQEGLAPLPTPTPSPAHTPPPAPTPSPVHH